MTRYDDAGLVTDDPVAAAMFIGREVKCLRWLDETAPLDGVADGIWYWWADSFLEQEDLPVLIPWPTVWAAIQPVEGEGYTFDYPDYSLSQELSVVPNYHGAVSLPFKTDYFHKRVLNIVTTRAELRELVEKARPKEVA